MEYVTNVKFQFHKQTKVLHYWGNLVLCFDFNGDSGFEGDGIVVLLAVGLSDKLLLQIVEPCLDTVRAHRVGSCYRFFDVLLHLPEETVAIGEYPIEGFDRDLLQ